MRTAVASHPHATAVVSYSVVAVAAAVAAYFAIFTQFLGTDDEGTLLVTLNAFVHGDTLYRDIYTPYGPFYYELFGGLFRLTGWPVSTDASRLIVIAVWVATSTLFGLVAQRLTGRLFLGLSGMIVAFGALEVLLGEPMHPHGAAVLLLGVFTLIVVSGPPKRLLLSGSAAGALLAALTLTKVNLGGFAVAAVGLAMVISIGGLRRRWWLLWPAVALFFAMPAVIMVRDLRLEWVRDFIALEFFSTTAILIAGWPSRPAAVEPEDRLAGWAMSALAGFAAAFAAILGVVLLTGSTPADIYEGLVDEALSIRDAFIVPFTASPASLDWAIASVAAAVLVSRFRRRTTEMLSVWPGLLRIAAGLAIWFTVSHSTPFSLNPSSGPDVLPMVLAWVAAIPAVGEESRWRRFARLLLPLLAVAENLQAYPVAGSQIGIAALLYVPVGAVCLADGLSSLRNWAAQAGAARTERVATTVAVAIIALAGIYAFRLIARPIANDLVLYRDQPSLSLSDAGLLHPPQAQAEEYERLVALLREHQCSTFVGYPSFDSLYLWSALPAPRPQIPGPWMLLFNDRRQQRVVAQLKAAPHPCAIRNQAQEQFWLQGASPPDTPLVQYVLNNFEPVVEVGEFEFLLPRRASAASGSTEEAEDGSENPIDIGIGHLSPKG